MSSPCFSFKVHWMNRLLLEIRIGAKVTAMRFRTKEMTVQQDGHLLARLQWRRSMQSTIQSNYICFQLRNALIASHKVVLVTIPHLNV